MGRKRVKRRTSQPATRREFTDEFKREAVEDCLNPSKRFTTAFVDTQRWDISPPRSSSRPHNPTPAPTIRG